MSVSRKILFNTVFSAVAKVGWTFIALFTIGIVTRHLGAEGFGDYTTILAFYFLLSSINDLGLSQIVLREISYDGKEKREGKIVSVAFTLRVLASLILIGLAFAASWALPYSEEVKKGIVLVSFGLFFSAGYQILTGIFQQRLMAYWVSAAEFLGRVANLAWVFACYQFNLGLLFVVGGMVLSWLTTFVIVFFLARKEVTLSLDFDKKVMKRLMKSALPLGIASFITFLYFKADTIILSVMKGSLDVGIYGAAYKIIENISYFPAMFMGLIMPFFARYIFSNREKFVEVADKAFTAIVFMGVGAGLGVFALAPKIIMIVAGSEFVESVRVLEVLAFAIIGLFLGQYYNMMLIAGKLQNKLLLIFCGGAVFNIITNVLLIPNYSYLAAAGTSVATELMVPILAGILAVRHFKIGFNWQVFLKVGAAGAVMVLFVLGLPGLPIYVQIVGGILIYGGMAMLLRAFTWEDFKEIIKIG